jgi:hypothetical protein
MKDLSMTVVRALPVELGKRTFPALISQAGQRYLRKCPTLRRRHRKCMLINLNHEFGAPGERLIWFVSFEESLSTLAALVIAAIALKLFKATVLTSALMGALASAVVAYFTWFEFTLEHDVVRYRNRFREIEFPLSYVKSVGMGTFWGGLPGHTFMFIMNCPPAPVNGYFLRTGLVSWPSATGWVEAVNSAVQSNAAETK